LKTSYYIQYLEACRLLDHTEQLSFSGKPLNCAMCVHLESAGIDPMNASLHLRQGIQRLKKYHERHDMAFAYCWVLENYGKKGVHAHLVIHRPKVMPMHPMKYWWDSLRCFQVVRSKGVLQFEKFRSMQSYEENIIRVTQYMLKGIRPEVAHLFKINPSNEGLIYGKRIGWSRGQNMENKL